MEVNEEKTQARNRGRVSGNTGRWKWVHFSPKFRKTTIMMMMILIILLRISIKMILLMIIIIIMIIVMIIIMIKDFKIIIIRRIKMIIIYFMRVTQVKYSPDYVFAMDPRFKGYILMILLATGWTIIVLQDFLSLPSLVLSTVTGNKDFLGLMWNHLIPWPINPDAADG